MRLLLLSMLVLAAFTSACQKKKDKDESSDSTTSSKYLYAVSGVCAAGSGVTTFAAGTASNMVFRVNLATGNRDLVVADYWATGASPGTDTPVGIANWDDNNVMILVTAGTTGRLEIAPKTSLSSRSVFNLSPSTATVLSTAPRGLLKTSDGGLLIVRTTGIERVSASGVRLGTTAYVTNTLGATCGNTNTAYTSVNLSSTQKILATVGLASPNNRAISVAATGAASAAGCLDGEAAPAGTLWPTASVYDKTNSKLLVAYAGNGVADNVNSIWAYSYDETTGVLSGGQEIYDSNLYPATYSYLLYSISSMTLDESTNTLYIASGNTNVANLATSGNYVIEKFTYNPSMIGVTNTSVLTRVSTNGQPFYNFGSDTKCISQMMIAN